MAIAQRLYARFIYPEAGARGDNNKAFGGFIRLLFCLAYTDLGVHIEQKRPRFKILLSEIVSYAPSHS